MSNKGKTVTDKEFKNVKLLQEADVRSSKVAELTGRSWATIDRIFKTEDFKGYQELVQSENKKWKAKRLAKVETAPVEREQSEEEKTAIQLLNNLTEEVSKLTAEVKTLSSLLEESQAVRKTPFWK